MDRLKPELADEYRFEKKGFITRDVNIRSDQASHALIFPVFLWLMARGEFVPTLESPCLESTHRISYAFNDVTSCWYVLDIPKIIVAAMLIIRLIAYITTLKSVLDSVYFAIKGGRGNWGRATRRFKEKR